MLCSCLLVNSTAGLRCGVPLRRLVGQMRHTDFTQRALAPEQILAVSQQAAAYAAVIAGEGFFNRQQMKESEAGRPSIVAIGAPGAVILVTLLLLQIESTQTPACILGLAASVAMLAVYIRRLGVTKGSPEDWPGPKVWPGTMALISFFALNVYFQALR
eukprot:TRINITY_DN2892_c0_g1_i5.p2 TRINITY_DN2892_c0_g1~~TRINITY_DN2892_c0_g1_i5.p2  ORF type:complete len:159 (-),score=19.60 TRINITY_DN2892_c0_g1_i5:279-755(-)